MVKPKKHLGQHFLTDRNIAEKIVKQLSDGNKAVVEVGAGTGVLTGFLIERFAEKLHIVEVDGESVDYLRARFPELGVRLLHADFLNTDLKRFAENEIAIIGNFPYNISSQIFFRVLDYRHYVAEVVCMIQKEVAQRIAAPPGSKTYGILSVLLQAWYEIEYCFTVNEQVFYPPPKVKSAVIRFKRNKVSSLECDEQLFQQVVKKAFNQRRKTLRNGLRDMLTPVLLQKEIFNKRAEQLGVSEFVSITKLISESRNPTITNH
jgi:16S rRNA (adenine1518-N6/adenine1519-N6)-dimethyltransferase